MAVTHGDEPRAVKPVELTTEEARAVFSRRRAAAAEAAAVAARAKSIQDADFSVPPPPDPYYGDRGEFQRARLGDGVPGAPGNKTSEYRLTLGAKIAGLLMIVASFVLIREGIEIEFAQQVMWVGAGLVGGPTLIYSLARSWLKRS